MSYILIDTGGELVINFVLEQTLFKLGLSKNKLAVESKVRPNTIIDIVNGNTRRMDMDTLDQVLDALNKIALERNLDRTFTINDIMIYNFKE